MRVIRLEVEKPFKSSNPTRKPAPTPSGHLSSTAESWIWVVNLLGHEFLCSTFLPCTTHQTCFMCSTKNVGREMCYAVLKVETGISFSPALVTHSAPCMMLDKFHGTCDLCSASPEDGELSEDRANATLITMSSHTRIWDKNSANSWLLDE